MFNRLKLPQHIISAEDLDTKAVEHILKKTKALQKGKHLKARDLSVALLFLQDSTRTKLSFQIAAERLGASIVDFDAAHSSLNKKESLMDTIETLIALEIEQCIVRHSSPSLVRDLAETFSEKPIRIINGGAGYWQHPTQALGDLYTLYQDCEYNLQSLKGKKLVLVGDCLHSRVLRSNLHLLKQAGMNITVVGPPDLAPKAFTSHGVRLEHDLHAGLEGADYIMIVRLHSERHYQSTTISASEYAKYYQITPQVLKEVGISPKILSPGPNIRGSDIAGELFDNPDVSLIHRQTTNCLYLRQALMYLLKHSTIV